jgi:hypothetical protein
MSGGRGDARARGFAIGIAATTAGRLAAILLSLLLSTQLVQWLGVATYGTWSFFFLLIGYSTLFDFGVTVGRAQHRRRACPRRCRRHRPDRQYVVRHRRGAGGSVAWAPDPRARSRCRGGR